MNIVAVPRCAVKSFVPIAPVSSVTPVHLMTDADFAALLADHEAFLSACESHYLPVDRYEVPFEADHAPHVVVPVMPDDDDAAYWQGYRVGFDGEEATAPSHWAASLRKQFAKGFEDGSDRLWEIDPAFASHCRERSEVARTLEPEPEFDPFEHLVYDEAVEFGGDLARTGHCRLAYN